MPNLNKLMLMGHLTRDVELKYAATGTAILSFGIAVNSGTKDKPEVYFGECVAFGKTAEFISKYAAKGAAIFIEGRLKLEQWEDKNTGKKQSKTRIVAERVQLLGGKDRTHAEPEEQPKEERRYTKEEAPPILPTEDPFEVPAEGEDGIPF